MRYVITIMSRKGKIRGRVACDTPKTKEYIVNTWLTYGEKKTFCVITDATTEEERVYEK